MLEEIRFLVQQVKALEERVLVKVEETNREIKTDHESLGITPGNLPALPVV